MIRFWEKWRNWRLRRTLASLRRQLAACGWEDSTIDLHPDVAIVQVLEYGRIPSGDSMYIN